VKQTGQLFFVWHDCYAKTVAVFVGFD